MATTTMEDTCASTAESCSSPSEEEQEKDAIISSKDNNDSSSSSATVASFRRSEVQLGKLLGEGYFCKVYEVVGFSLNVKSNGGGGGQPHHYKEEERNARISCQDTARRTKDGQPRYAMKHLHPRLLSDMTGFHSAVLDLVTEANFLTELHHPNILKIRGIAQGGTAAFRGGSYDSFFLITDRLSETLAQRIQRWKNNSKQRRRRRSAAGTCTSTTRSGPAAATATAAVSIEQKMMYALQIAKGLLYLHERKLIFRDLKPNNCGFCQDNPHKLQLFDFGLCRNMPSSSSSSDSSRNDVFDMSGVGTRRYMAPEVCLNKPYNQKADVYSWAMVFVELLTEEKPFAEFTKDDHHQFVCQLGGCPNLSKWKSVPANLKDLLRQTWCHTVSRRWTAAQACQRLETLLSAANNDSNADGCVDRVDSSMPGVLSTEPSSNGTNTGTQRHQRKGNGFDRKSLMETFAGKSGSSRMITVQG